MHFLYPPDFASADIQPQYEDEFLLPYASARHVTGPFGDLFTQAIYEEQYYIDLQVVFSKEPFTFTAVRERVAVVLLYVFQGDITLGNERGRKRKLEDFSCYVAYLPQGHYTVAVGTGIHWAVQIEFPPFALFQLAKYFEIFMLWNLADRDSRADALLYISETSYKVSDTIRSLLHCPLAAEERTLFQMGRIMDLLVFLAEDITALYKDSAGALKFTPDDIKAVQYALDLQADPENTFTLYELARTVNMHPRKLTEGFRLLKGKTSRALATEARIEKAKKLLLETQMPVSEIAYETGYCNSSALIRAFKRSVGISPSTYRK